ncbi:MAG: flagellar basal body L-ring protein FlgH [Pirellulales bacterium]|nr:flagellar basal body L-ring protein FlgH [Pirellulales bacterium]
MKFSIIIAAIGLTLAFAGESFGQNSSLLGPENQRQGLTLERSSWTYQKVLEARPIGLNDQVTVLVNNKSVFINDGQMDRKKNGYGSLKLSDWILLKGFSVIPDPQSAGDPKIRGEVDNKLRSQANLETREQLEFKISCKVVDIRPNGILVIEGTNFVENNDEVSNYSLSGEIRAEDIKPDNTVLSSSIASLRIKKYEEGHVRDGYRRGWMLKWLDKYQPF